MAKKAKRRPGGRPALPPGMKHVVVSITLPPAQLAWVDERVSVEVSRSAVIQGLIERAMKGGRRGR